jgi:predicted transcriptional regulator of viral defense system
MVAQVSQEPKQQVRVQLHRWAKSGKVIRLRRGLYTLANDYRKTDLHGAYLANEIYKPSYLSRQWALGYWGVIPEKVVVFTSVSSRVTRSFENPFGAFQYSSVHRDFFFGFAKNEIQGIPVWLASPEKALLDFWHLQSGTWTAERMVELRIQNQEILDEDLLVEFADRFRSKRLHHAVEIWKEVRSSESDGTIKL